ncbi:MAG: hypothetical protein WKF37_03960 [Bryobacteraceae bacterium]
MKASEYAELRELGDEVASACAAPPLCGGGDEPLALPLPGTSIPISIRPGQA